MTDATASLDANATPVIVIKRPKFVILRNKITGELKKQKIGWSWTCFFWSYLGIPLFIRRLNVWGATVVAFYLTGLLMDALPYPEGKAASIVLGIIGFVFAVHFGRAANSMAGKQFLENGWEFADAPIAVATAKAMWGLA
jgi:hypothetical protein